MYRRLIAVLVFAATSAAVLAAAPAGEKLSVGLMPAVDSATAFIAERRGYFADAGLDVTLTVFTNAVERQVALQTGAVDGAISDLIAFVYNVQGGFDLRISSSADGSFPFLVRKGFAEKQRVSVGMMEVSVVNYLADEWLGGTYAIDKVFINEIPARLEMIRQGKIDMACLPEPVASMGELSGLEKRVFPNRDAYWPDVFVFTAATAAKKESAIRRFHGALDRAAADIARDPGIARDILVEKLKLDPRVRDMMVLPVYHPTRLPDAAYLAKVTKWIAGLQGRQVSIDWTKYLLEPASPAR